ncbi:hypothetical protein HDV01_005302 [Terramyces sp. JEL0728]|nr:hypothetical protein HDV01_005302 [Terramyces sp. JEL0728]
MQENEIRISKIKNELFVVLNHLKLLEYFELRYAIRIKLDFITQANHNRWIFGYFNCDDRGPKDHHNPYFINFKEFLAFLFNTGTLIQSILKIKHMVAIRPYMQFQQFDPKQLLLENSIEYLASLVYNSNRNFQYILNQEVVDGNIYTIDCFLKSNLQLDYSLPFILAIKHSRFEILKLLLADSRVDPCCFKSRGLVLACGMRSIDIPQLLLKDGRVVSNSAIVVASYRGRIDILKLLLQDQRLKVTNRALRDAATMGHLKICQLLITHGLDPSADGNLAFQRACQNGHLGLAEFLLQDRRVDPAARNNQAIRQSARRGYSDIVKLLLKDERVDKNANSCEAAIQAAISGHFSLTESLLDGNIHKVFEFTAQSENISILCSSVHGGGITLINHVLELVDRGSGTVEYPNRDRLNEALLRACKKGYTRVAKYILQLNDSDSLYYSGCLLRNAISNGHLEIVKLLLQDSRLNPSVNRNEMVRLAAAKGCTEIVGLLLRNEKVDPNMCLKKETALTLAVRNQHFETVKLLLESKRVDPTLYDSMAFREAAKINNFGLMELFIRDARSVFSAKQSEAFKSAVQVGNPRIIEMLLKEKSISPNSEHNFALKHAAQMGYYEIAEMLAKDPRVDVHCDNDHALWRAEIHGQQRIVDLLREFK